MGNLARMLVLAASLTVILSVTGCQDDDAMNDDRSTAATASGIDRSAFASDVRPQDDFFAYVNGGWLASTDIPADKSSWGSFVELSDRAQDDLRAVVDSLAKAGPASLDADARKVQALYRSFMDQDRIESLGLAPLKDDLAAIDAIDSRQALVDWLGRMQPSLVSTPVALFVDQDLKHSDRYIVYLTQNGLGMPDRDYYLKDEPRLVQIRKQYHDYLSRLFQLSGTVPADQLSQRVDAVYGLEHALAEAQWPRTRLRERELTYNPRTVAEIDREAPDVDWAGMLKSAGLDDPGTFIVRQPDYLASLAGLLKSTPLPVWRDYLRARLLDATASYLPADFDQASFDFHGKALTGAEAQRPRWRRAVALLDQAIGEAVGKLYVERHFKPEAKARMDELVRNLEVAYRQAIDQLDWMSDATRKEAQAKLARFNAKIGYPEKWRDYSALTIHENDLLGNVERASRFDYQRRLARLHDPVDRSEWEMTPQTVNAYYNPPMNEVVFPAAILQPPFFNVHADDAVNYGAIGGVIGHEISHGFDDQGRKSDGEGNLRDWWTDEDAARFKERTARLVAQYNGFSPLEGLHVNGQLTLGENIADLSGLAVAYRAYHASLNGHAAPVIDGLTGDQRFFMGFAQVWRYKQRDDLARQRVLTDPHSPPHFRVLGTLRNFDPFYAAFDVTKGDGMYLPPDQRVEIW